MFDHMLKKALWGTFDEPQRKSVWLWPNVPIETNWYVWLSQNLSIWGAMPWMFHRSVLKKKHQPNLIMEQRHPTPEPVELPIKKKRNHKWLVYLTVDSVKRTRDTFSSGKVLDPRDPHGRQKCILDIMTIWSMMLIQIPRHLSTRRKRRSERAKIFHHWVFATPCGKKTGIQRGGLGFEGEDRFFEMIRMCTTDDRFDQSIHYHLADSDFT